ncbi:MAG: ABC transporter permease subunit [Planctomycetes bacterium]|nr:ABC transporter permease subunit [Planctomycetota bacterium]
MKTLKAAWETFGLDPVMRKEFYGISRRWQTYAFRAVYVGVLTLAVWSMWKTFEENLLRYFAFTGQMDYSMYAQFGRELFVGFSAVQYVLLALVAVIAGSDLISKEVREGTLGILAITPLISRRIVWGKWKSAVGYTAIILVSGIPVLALGIYMGGVEPGDLLRVTALTLSTAVLCAAFAILCSSLTRHAYQSLLLGTLGMILYALVPVTVEFFLGNGRFPEWAPWAHPVYAFAAVLGRTARSANVLEYSWISSSCVSIFLAALCLGVTSLRLRWLIKSVPRPPLIRRFFERLDRIFESSRLGVRIWKVGGDVWDFNPCLWKEFRSQITGRVHYLVRIGVVVLGGLTLLFSMALQKRWDEMVFISIYLILMVIWILACVGAGAAAFTKEKEEKKWDLLLTTPMGAGQILGAKLAGAFLNVAVPVLTLCFFCLLLFVFSEGRFGSLLFSTLIFGGFTICVGLFFSQMVGQTRKAYFLTLMVLVLILAVIPTALAIMEVSQRSPFRRQVLVEPFLWATSPFMYLRTLVRYNPPDGWQHAASLGVIYALASAILAGVCESRLQKR